MNQEGSAKAARAGLAVIASAAFSYGMAFGVTCWPFDLSCLEPGGLVSNFGTAIFFAPVFIFESALLFCLFWVPRIRHIMFHPVSATLLVLANLIAGYFLAPHGKGP